MKKHLIYVDDALPIWELLIGFITFKLGTTMHLEQSAILS